MDISLFASLLRNLLQANVMYTDGKTEDLEYFERTYCFHEKLQPMFTSQALAYLMEAVKENTFYEIIDDLDIGLLFFSFADHTFFVGPYARSVYEDAKMQALLAQNKIPASFALPLRLYYTDLPMQSSSHMQNTISACVKSFSPACTEFSYRRLHGFHEPVTPDAEDTSVNYNQIYHRYDMENRFLQTIENGNVEEVLTAYDEYNRLSPTPISVKMYQNPLTSLSVIRALTRKAAEHGGLSVITIDAITQKAVQQMNSSNSMYEQVNISRAMALELAQAVRDHNLAVGHLSPSIGKVAEYLRLNYSREIHLSSLADMVHFSQSHLSRQFKAETGETITRYVARLRCNHAAQLLKQTRLSVQEISAFIGYTDNNYFVKVFKNQYGVTPSAYREKAS